MMAIISSHEFIFLLLSILLFGCLVMLWKSFLSRALCETNGNPSSKRAITFLFAWLTIEVILFAVIFQRTIADNIVMMLTTVLTGGMALTIPALFRKDNQAA